MGSCSEIIKPPLIGDDVRRYETHSRERFLLYVRWDCDIRCYPAVLRWLKTFGPRLEQRDGVKGNGSCLLVRPELVLAQKPRIGTASQR